MNQIIEPMPWYLAGPLIGIILGVLLIYGNRSLGISSSFRHICAATLPKKIPFFNYNWKTQKWNLFFALGIILGGVVNHVVVGQGTVPLNPKTVNTLTQLGITDFTGLMPTELFQFERFSLRSLFFIFIGGLLVGFGTRWAGGCTSGHSIMGLSNLQWPSLVASIFFFIGGVFATFVLIPLFL